MPCLQHVLIPDIPRDGELFFEALMVVFVCTGLGLQYLNMYRTIWWLPHSYTLYAMVSTGIGLQGLGCVAMWC